MSMPFYVSPEQIMKDRADYARKNIARGRPVVVIEYADGLLFAAENRSRALHKISEIYDRVAFAAVGRYNEFENLRIAGVRLADMRGYSYDRRDVTGRGLANAYAQTLGTIFSSGGEKPYEVELFVAEVGETPDEDQIYRLMYDGSVADEHDYAVMGGSADVIATHLKEHYRAGLDLEATLRLAVDSLGHDTGEVRSISGDQLEVAVLDRSRSQPRKFRRLPQVRLVELFGRGTEVAGGADRPGIESESESGESSETRTAVAAVPGGQGTADRSVVDPAAPLEGGEPTIDPTRPGDSTGGDPADEVGEPPDSSSSD
jgi:proteasome alpha subunit